MNMSHLPQRTLPEFTGQPAITDDSLHHLINRAAAALAGLALITLPAEYDLAAFRLRGLLQRVDRLPVSRLPSTGADAAILMWRLQTLDRHCETHFLTGLPNLAAWGKRLLAHDSSADLRAPLAAQRFLSQQRHLGGLLTMPQRDHLWHPLCHDAGQIPAKLGTVIPFPSKSASET